MLPAVLGASIYARSSHLPLTSLTPVLCSTRLAAAKRDLGATEERLAEKAGRLRASLQQEVAAAQGKVRRGVTDTFC